MVERSAARNLRRGLDGICDRATVGAGIQREPQLALLIAPCGAMADPTQLGLVGTAAST